MSIRYQAPLVHVMPIDLAIGDAKRVLKEIGRPRHSDRECSVLAREFQRLHTAGRLSMLREVAKQLGMRVLGDET